MLISFDKVDINYGSNWDKHYPKIPQDEPIIFWDEFHCDRLYPFIEGVPGGWNEIYLILTSEFKQEKIYYVTSDFNIEWQVEKVKKAIVENGEEIKTKIHFLYHPYTMCYDEFFRLNNNKILGVTKNTLWDGSKYKTFDYKYNFEYEGNNVREVLGVILLYDQLSRNIFRGSAESYKYDKMVIKFMLNNFHLSNELEGWEKIFFLMPLKHSEDLHYQKYNVKLWKNISEYVIDSKYEKLYERNQKSCEKHFNIIKIYRRFPKKNKILLM